MTEAGRWAADQILDRIRATLASVGIVFDEWYSQASIEESGAVDETIAELADKGLVFEEDGAIWFRATELGDNRDRVLRKSNGDATYLAGDIAYHRDKFVVRGFDRVIDVFGADHHGQVASLFAGVEALGVDPTRLEVKLGQMVSLVDGDEAVKMGKRAGNAVSLDSLVADIGPDATRILSPHDLPRPGQHLRPGRRCGSSRWTTRSSTCRWPQPVSAGWCARRPNGASAAVPAAEVDLTLLTHERELELIRCLEELPEVVADAAVGPGPDQGHRLGAPPGHRFPRLLPRLPDPGRRRRPRADPGPPVAGRGGPDRTGHRTGSARRVGPGVDVNAPAPGRRLPIRRTRWPASCCP